jgi:molybdate transport system ATP-binding protein
MNSLRLNLSQDSPIPLEVAFDCAPGEMLALVGPSGSGKTTILRAIAGNYKPKQGFISVSGTVWFDAGANMFIPSHDRSVGMVFQSYALFPHMNALENVAAALGHLPRGERKLRAQELLDRVNLNGLEKRRPSSLSGGQQQRIAVARALARDPAVLLLDEPFAAVDRATRQRLYREIADLHSTLSMPIVLVTHDLDEAMMLADRVAIIHRGSLLQIGIPSDVVLKPASAEVAHLLDLRNIFKARVIEHELEHEVSYLDWHGLRIETSLNLRPPCGVDVSWVVPDGYVLLHRRDRPSRGEHENPVPGTIGSLVVIGQIAQLTLIPHHEPSLPIHFSIPLHVASRNGIDVGVEAAVSLLAEGIHIMSLQVDNED